MASFAPIPDVPFEGLNLAESSLFKAMKENIEILAGARATGVHAVMSDTITIQPTNNQQMIAVTARANAVDYPNGATLAAQTGHIIIINYAEFVALVSDVQQVINDLGRVQSVVNSLIGQLQR
jgi:hypothetical protein